MAIRNIFESQQVNPYGIYFVKFFHNGIWKYEIIDDSIPVIEVHKKKKVVYRPMFTYGEISKSKNEPV